MRPKAVPSQHRRRGRKGLEMYIFCLKRIDDPEAEKIRTFAAEIRARDSAARIEIKEEDGFCSCFAYSKALGGYLSNYFNMPLLRLHTLGNNDDYFELPLSCINTLYEL